MSKYKATIIGDSVKKVYSAYVNNLLIGVTDELKKARQLLGDYFLEKKLSKDEVVNHVVIKEFRTKNQNEKWPVWLYVRGTKPKGLKL
ncbi:hypothetical protein [Paenibacillus chitinolyticus]|uniref:hypothetical protein n=1 Tax=Paenibacillus chitinolyticus TaxID=79263 RepID=UPI0036488445